ncbi:EmrB/QacA subfamily drug resistance transporter [Rhodanobacter sp. 115]|nr:EmrB/QacA subfamily drug resistance transporter [Rhodanobacter sp. 115]
MSTHYQPPNLALATIGLSLAIFMQALDSTIANVSLPAIAGNLGVSANESTWVITSFAVSMAISLPLTGFLSRRFGETRLFIWTTLLFVASSLLCGLSRSMGTLILFRAIQGAVAGPMYPITQSLMIGIYPNHKRGMALALLSMVAVVAPIAGPILGGWITDNYSWPWIFLHQRAGRHFRQHGGGQPDERPGGDHHAPEGGLRGPDRADRRRGRAADRAGQGQRRRLVRLRLHRHHQHHRRARSDHLPDLGADRQGPHRRPEAVPPPQLQVRHAGAGAVVCGVLRDQPAAAAMAAAQPGLHRHLGRFRRCATGHHPGDADLHRGQVRDAFRPAPAHQRRLRGNGRHLLHPRQLLHRHRLLPRRRRAIADGAGRGAVLHAGDGDPAVRSGAERDRLRLGPGHLPAHAGRQLRRLHHHLAVGPPRRAPPCAAERAHHALQHQRTHGTGRIRPRQCTGRRRRGERHDHPAELPDRLQRTVPLAGLDLPWPDRGDLAGQAAVHGQGRGVGGRALSPGLDWPHLCPEERAGGTHKRQHVAAAFLRRGIPAARPVSISDPTGLV